jgi:hypothetical protein
MSTLKTNTLSNVAGTASTAIENAINGSAKAWVNFNGTGTVAIRASYNVTSITDLGTGYYQVNFTNAFPDVNYSAQGNCQNISGSYSSVTWQPNSSSVAGITTPTTTSCTGVVAVATIGNVDCANINLSFFR